MEKIWKELREVEFIDKRVYSLGEILEKCISDSCIYILYYNPFDTLAIAEARFRSIEEIRVHYESQNSVFIRLKEQYSTEIIKEKIE